MAVRAFGLVLGLSGLCLAQPAPTLSLETALRAASETTLHVRAHEAAANAAREMAIAARALPDPQLRLSLDNVPVEGSAQWSLRQDFMTMQTVGLMQTFVADAKRAALSDRYEQEARLVDATRVVELAALQRATAQAWLDRYFQEGLLGLLQQQRAEVDLLLATTEAAYRAGQAPQMDVFSARAEAATLDDRMREARILLDNALASLERWIGPDARLPLAPLPPLEDMDVQLADVIPQAEFAWLAQQEELALAATRVARMSRKPDWNVELMYGQRGPAFENMISLGVSIPLQLGRRNKQDREIAASLAALDNVRQLREEQMKDYQLQTRQWRASWQGNQERLRLYDASLVPLARQRTEAAVLAYRGNTADLATALAARRAEIDLQVERLQLERATAELWTRLRLLMPLPAAAPMFPSPGPDDVQEQ